MRGVKEEIFLLRTFVLHSHRQPVQQKELERKPAGPQQSAPVRHPKLNSPLETRP
jgi:hypothetical protein